MKGEKVHFRRKFFGGFNQDDVISYIAAISKQRDESVDAKIKAERELGMLKDEITQLKEKLASRQPPPMHPPAPDPATPPPKPVIVIKRKKTMKWSDNNDF